MAPKHSVIKGLPCSKLKNDLQSSQTARVLTLNLGGPLLAEEIENKSTLLQGGVISQSCTLT